MYSWLWLPWSEFTLISRQPLGNELSWPIRSSWVRKRAQIRRKAIQWNNHIGSIMTLKRISACSYCRLIERSSPGHNSFGYLPPSSSLKSTEEILPELSKKRSDNKGQYLNVVQLLTCIRGYDCRDQNQTRCRRVTLTRFKMPSGNANKVRDGVISAVPYFVDVTFVLGVVILIYQYVMFRIKADKSLSGSLIDPKTPFGKFLQGMFAMIFSYVMIQVGNPISGYMQVGILVTCCLPYSNRTLN